MGIKPGLLRESPGCFIFLTMREQLFSKTTVSLLHIFVLPDTSFDAANGKLGSSFVFVLDGVNIVSH